VSVKLTVYVQPGAKKTAVVGMHGDYLKISLNAPPVEGAANKQLIYFLAEKLKLKMKAIELVNGEKSRIKTVNISLDAHQTISLHEIINRLLQKS
jgi:uncharacterized protein (TIGR00251 family)